MSTREDIWSRLRARQMSPPALSRESRMPRSAVLMALIGLLMGAGVAAQNLATDWPHVGHDAGGMKYSPLTQITPANVSRLTKAWSYALGVPATGYTPSPARRGRSSTPW